MGDQAIECLLPGITTPVDPPDPRDIHELFVALIEGAYTFAGFGGPTAEGLAPPLCVPSSRWFGVRQVTIFGRSLQFRFPICASTLIGTAMASTLIICRSQSETVAPDKTVVSTTGFSLALQFGVSVSDLHIASRIG